MRHVSKALASEVNGNLCKELACFDRCSFALEQFLVVLNYGFLVINKVVEHMHSFDVQGPAIG